MSDRNKAAKGGSSSIVLFACVCGEMPESQVRGIGDDEYDEIECPACNRMVRQGRGDAIKAATIWNEMLSSGDCHANTYSPDLDPDNSKS